MNILNPLGIKPARKKPRKYSEVLADLQDRFHNGGERMTVVEIAQEYLQPKNTTEFILADRVVRGWLNTLKRRFSKDKIYFGCLNEDGEYGLALNKAEYYFILEGYYKRTKSMVERAVLARNEAATKGLLPQGRDVKLLGFHITEKPEENQ